jgi:hypothetical protein
LKVPAGQRWQVSSAAPTVFENQPAGHSWQEERSVASAGEKLPMGHARHFRLPEVDE